MRFFMKKILIFLTLMLCFTGCTHHGETPERTETGDGETEKNNQTTPPDTTDDVLYFVDENKKSLYTVVYSAEAIEVVRGAAELLRGSIADATQTIVRKENDTKTVSTPREILIGKTNRTEEALFEGLGKRDWRILSEDGRIVIVGGSDFATARAVMEFQKLFGADTPYVPNNLSVNGSVSDVYRVALTNSGERTIDVYELFPFDADECRLVRRYPVKVGSTGINFRIDRNGREVIVAGSGTYAYVLDLETGELIWETYGAASSTHGAELLPNGIVATASSGSGSELRLFDMDGQLKYASVDFPDAHGVLWDPTLEVLWAVGSNLLRAYRVEKTADRIVMTEDESLRTELPTASGHDISPIYGDPDRLWITTTKEVYRFDKTTKQITRFARTGVVTKSVKGIGSYPDGTLVTTYPDEKPTSLYTWTTEKINLYFNLGGDLYPFFYETPGMHYYKCRVVNTSYQ